MVDNERLMQVWKTEYGHHLLYTRLHSENDQEPSTFTAEDKNEDTVCACARERRRKREGKSESKPREKREICSGVVDPSPVFRERTDIDEGEHKWDGQPRLSCSEVSQQTHTHTKLWG